MRNPAIRTSVVLAACVLAAGVASALELGDKAPELEGLDWVKGEAVSLAAAKGKDVVVVEFWATWCGPCMVSIPHLSELQAKCKDKGLVVVGVSDEKLDDVKNWLAAKKTLKMDYNVAVDAKGDVYKKYMEKVGGIPHAFLVDKTGTIVWQGHPMDGLDEVVAKVLAGTFDVKKAVEEADRRRKKEAEIEPIRRKVEAAAQARDFDEVLKLCDELIKADPSNPQSYELKVRVLNHLNKTDEILPVRRAMAKAVSDDAEALSYLAWHLAADENLAARDLALAAQCALRAKELTKGKDATVLYALGTAYAGMGLWDKAIAAQTEAAKVADDRQKARVEAALQYCKRAKADAAKYAAQ